MNEFTKRPSNANVRSNAFYLYSVSLSRINIKAPYKSGKDLCRAVTDKLLGKKFRERFRNEVTNKCLTEKPLIEVGIHPHHDNYCSWCQPMYDEKQDCYILSCSDSLPHGFDKSIDKTQFEIEY